MNLDKITLYYNRDGLQNHLIGIIGDYQSDEKKILNDNIVYYYKGKVVGFNINNGDKFINNDCQGMIYPTKQLLTEISDHLKINLNEFINQKTFLIGFVKECTPIPKSHLHFCKVSINESMMLDIVCGAKNVEINKKVVVATIGTRLPNGKLIKESKILNHQSQGMLCSGKELNLSDDNEGIIILPDDTSFPSDFLKVYKFV